MSRNIGYFDGSTPVLTADIIYWLNSGQSDVAFTAVEYFDAPEYGGKILSVTGTDLVNNDEVTACIPVQRSGDDLLTDPPGAPSYTLCAKGGSCCGKCRAGKDSTCVCVNCNCSACTCEKRDYTWSASYIVEAHA